jgi:hypothetical protein
LTVVRIAFDDEVALSESAYFPSMKQFIQRRDSSIGGNPFSKSR